MSDIVRYLLYGGIVIVGSLCGTLLILLILRLFRRKDKDIADETPAVAPAPVVEKIVTVEKPVYVEKIVTVERPQIEMFTLSRLDVTEHVKSMKKQGEKFPIIPNVKARTEEKLPDYLMCGERCFAIMFERGEIVFNLLLYMNAADADKHAETHILKRATYMGDDWYNLIIDNTFTGKREIYDILDLCYIHTAKNYRKDNKGKQDEQAKAEADAEARAFQAELEKKSLDNMGEIVAAAEAAEKKYRDELAAAMAELESGKYVKFMLTRKEIAENAKETGGRAVTVVERADSQLPMSLKYGAKTFAMLYGTDAGIVMVVRIPAEYADEFVKEHPAIRPAKFPRKWYQIPIDGTFKDKESVFRVLAYAANYVKESTIEQQERKAAKAVVAAEAERKAEKDKKGIDK